jgi:hypothetical protein
MDGRIRLSIHSSGSEAASGGQPAYLYRILYVDPLQTFLKRIGIFTVDWQLAVWRFRCTGYQLSARGKR